MTDRPGGPWLAALAAAQAALRAAPTAPKLAADYDRAHRDWVACIRPARN